MTEPEWPVPEQAVEAARRQLGYAHHWRLFVLRMLEKAWPLHPAVAEVELLRAALKEANDVLRSTWQIAAREGKDTNWETFASRVHVVLMAQHRLMHPEQDAALAQQEGNRE